MIPKNISRPTQTHATLIIRLIIPDSAEERMCVRTVAITMKKGMGAKEYPVAIRISLALPSPSNRVVRHQLAATHRAIGIKRLRACAPMLE